MTLKCTPNFIKNGLKLCPWEGMEWEGGDIHDRENIRVLGLPTGLKNQLVFDINVCFQVRVEMC